MTRPELRWRVRCRRPGEVVAEAGRPRVADDDEDAASFSEVRLYVPGAIQVAFDQALELHRVVSGGQVRVRDFVEALAAEALSGAVPAEVDLLDPRPGPPQARTPSKKASRNRGRASAPVGRSRKLQSGPPHASSKALNSLEFSASLLMA